MIRDQILSDTIDLDDIKNKTFERIMKSKAAEKFLNSKNDYFPLSDLIYCTMYYESDFIMTVASDDNYLTLQKEYI